MDLYLRFDQPLSDIETDEGSNKINIEAFVDDTLYILNEGNNNVTLSTIKVGSQDCSLTTPIVPQMNSYNLSSCIIPSQRETVQEIVVITNVGIVQESFYII